MEALLRADDRPFFLLNEGSPKSIVLGISSDVEEMVHTTKISTDPLPIIRRFSGGGSVVVDEDTLFLTWILPKKGAFESATPESIVSWAHRLYADAFQKTPLLLQENDFVINNAKCAGNAFYLRKDRWLLHSSFLWKFCKTNMAYLKHPPKTPSYRAGRSHEAFLTPLNAHFSSKDQLIRSILNRIQQEFFLKKFSLEEALFMKTRPHRKATTLL